MLAFAVIVKKKIWKDLKGRKREREKERTREKGLHVREKERRGQREGGGCGDDDEDDDRAAKLSLNTLAINFDVASAFRFFSNRVSFSLRQREERVVLDRIWI